MAEIAIDMYLAYENGYEAGKKDATQKWISVKERLPEQNQRVLVCGVRGGVQICRYLENRDYGGGLQYMFFTNKQRPMTVTHWMPLPELPKEGGGENVD